MLSCKGKRKKGSILTVGLNIPASQGTSESTQVWNVKVCLLEQHGSREHTSHDFLPLVFAT